MIVKLMSAAVVGLALVASAQAQVPSKDPDSFPRNSNAADYHPQEAKDTSVPSTAKDEQNRTGDETESTVPQKR